MGHSPKIKSKAEESDPDGLHSRTITFLLATGVSRIYSINKLMIIAKGEEPHTSDQTSKRVS